MTPFLFYNDPSSFDFSNPAVGHNKVVNKKENDDNDDSTQKYKEVEFKISIRFGVRFFFVQSLNVVVPMFCFIS